MGSETGSPSHDQAQKLREDLRHEVQVMCHVLESAVGAVRWSQIWGRWDTESDWKPALLPGGKQLVAALLAS